MRILGWLVAIAGAVLMLACGGSGGSTVSAVTVVCSPINVESGTNAQCSATVSGTGGYNSAVTWIASAGSISTTGVFSAPSVADPTGVTIEAKSVQNPSIIGGFALTVFPPGPTISLVTAVCSPNVVQAGQTSQCSATVTGTGSFDPSVTWSANGGTISSTGLFTGGNVAINTQAMITATSVQDIRKSGSTTVSVLPSGTVTSISVSCALTNINSGQDSQCTAAVNGTGNFSSAVTWTATGGAVTPGGLFVAPTVSAPTPVTVTARSSQNTSVTGTSTVTVNPIAAGNNVVPVTVDPGPTGSYVNGAFASATVCVPGTSTCQTIDHLLVDTGSVGVRLLAAGAAGGQLSLALPQQNASDGNPLHECYTLQNAFTWGPVASADVQLGGEQASNIPVQVIGQANEAAVPSSCGSGLINKSTLTALGANGILGVGLFPQDCGSSCTLGQPPNNVYYSCTPAACAHTMLGVTSQVQNPVSFIPQDNNGTLLQLPAVAAPGTTTISGSLILGIGTQSNNATTGATAYTTTTAGQFLVTYAGNNYPGFISSGQNAYYFLNSAFLPQLPACTGAQAAYYCPASTQAISAINTGANGASNTVNFNVDNATTLITGNPTFAVFPTLGGPSAPSTTLFEWGLPFFYGRNVFTALQGSSTPLGPGPYWAY